MNITQKVALNLSVDGIPPRLHMPQGDGGRIIAATLWNGAAPYAPPAGTLCMLRFGKPDGTGGLYDEAENGEKITLSGNAATIPVALQVLAAAGQVFCQLELYAPDADGLPSANRLATFAFAIGVAPSVYPDAEIVSGDYINIVTEALLAKFADIVSHHPQIGADGKWELWDVEQSKYIATDFPAIATRWWPTTQTGMGGGQNAWAKPAGSAGYVDHPQKGDYLFNQATGDLYYVNASTETDSGGTYSWSYAGTLKGPDGATPHIGDNGHWYIGDEDTGIIAGEVRLLAVTVAAAQWEGDEAPWSQTLAVPGVTDKSLNAVYLAASATDEQREAWNLAAIADGGQAAGEITLLAYGEKPEIDIPIIVSVGAIAVSPGGAEYTLPVASPSTLGGVKTPAKTAGMTKPVGVDAGGGLWTEPDEYTLPVADDDTLGGVKPAAKTEDMTEEVGVDADGGLWCKPSTGTSGGETVYVDITASGTDAIGNTIYAANMTFAEITQAYSGGKDVVARHGGAALKNLYKLDFVGDSALTFSSASSLGFLRQEVEIATWMCYSDNTWEFKSSKVLPNVTAADNGKFLQVSSYGDWEAAALPVYSGEVE